jgi:hypothetical protein
MAERRPLIEGLKELPPNNSVNPAVERAFVKGTLTNVLEPKTANPPLAKAPLSTRIRADFAAALKRASLERQLSGKEPNTLQDILEEAIEPWLRNNGHLA